jgi:hypothetical protein
LVEASHEAYSKYVSGEATPQLFIYQKYTIVISANYHSHRTKIAKTISALLRNNLNEATKQIQETIKMLEDAHQQYHQFASSKYLKRAKIFSLLGEVELSKNDIRKANDLVGSVATNEIDI